MTAKPNPAAKSNRLAGETSPYLLQHAHNPVDWYAWGPEAFTAARTQNKAIFLSVGYSTCYWCHVMERQCFENERVAFQMNQQFINIKVDREERPDVDQLYMTAVQVLTQHGGWPMSVWLTPDLKPFFGGTYFPPEDAAGRPGFVTVCNNLFDAFEHRRSDVERSASQLVKVLEQVSRLVKPKNPITLDLDWITRLVDRSVSDYEPKFGGFGDAPKFPRETLLELLLHWLDTPGRFGELTVDIKRAARVRQMLAHTLDAMALGGIRDQLGGGFHRYSTDARWLVPHFEIMLYDNALLGLIYAKAAKTLGDVRYATIAGEVFDFILREMTSPQGAFYTAFDAEVDAREGLSYLWTLAEVESLLTPADAELFAKVYGLDQGPNFVDPHHSEGGPEQNILFVADANLADAQAARLKPMRQTLLQARAARKQPLLDTKILTSWNALTIRALAFAGRVLNRPTYTAAAIKAATFLLDQHATPEGGLYRTSRDGVKKFNAFLDDYACLAEALLELHEATGDDQWRQNAQRIAGVMVERFGDGEQGGFFFTEASSSDLVVRQKVAADSPLPSGNAVAARVLQRLGKPIQTAGVLSAFAQQTDAHGEGMSAMVQAALLYLADHDPIAVPAAPPAAEVPMDPQELATRVVSIGAEWISSVTLKMTLMIKPGYHLNANPAADGMVATEILVEGSTVASIDYPQAAHKTFAFSESPMPVYESSAEVLIHFAEEPAGRQVLTLIYQACDESSCLPPVRKRTAFEL